MVVGVESDPDNNSINARKMKLAGHGMPVSTPAVYAREMVTFLNGAIKKAQQDIAQNRDGKVSAFMNNNGFIFLQWDPYPGILGSSDAPHPWFIWLPRVFPHRVKSPAYKTRWNGIATMNAAIQHSVVDDPQTPQAPDYTPRPPTVTIGPTTYTLSDGVLFPLFLPVSTDDGTTLEWSDYFQRRHGHPELNVLLQAIRLSFTAVGSNPITGVTGDIPGLLVAGTDLLPIQVLRPKVQK